MTLQIDASEAFMRPNELVKLVDAVFAADPGDEQDWLEWKSQLDLADKAGQFHVARTILALANRDPSAARDFAGGFGYLLVGVEPGRITGCATLDPAKLDDGVSRYTGDGPRWAAHVVSKQEGEVLLVVVQPPEAGDPIYPLCKTFQPAAKGGGADQGTVFVRRGTKSRPASAADIRMLTERARDGSKAEMVLLELERQRDLERRTNQARFTSVDLFTQGVASEAGEAAVDIAARFSNDSDGPLRRVRIGVRADSGWYWGPQLISTLRPGEEAVLHFRLFGAVDESGLNAVMRFQDIHDCYWTADARYSVEPDTSDTSTWIQAGQIFAARVDSPELRGRVSTGFGTENGLENWQAFLNDLAITEMNSDDPV